jgi:hypothetical protein
MATRISLESRRPSIDRRLPSINRRTAWMQIRATNVTTAAMAPQAFCFFGGRWKGYHLRESLYRALDTEAE